MLGERPAMLEHESLSAFIGVYRRFLFFLVTQTGTGRSSSPVHVPTNATARRET